MSLRARLYEGALILMACFTLYLVVALVTYHTADPAWSTTGESDVITNAAGRVGAWLADVVLYVFGYVGYLLPIFLAGLTFLLFRLHLQKPVLSALILWVAGSLLLFFAATSLLSLHSTEQVSYLPLSAGGAFGDWFSRLLTGWLNKVGAVILLIAILLTGITLVLGVSWLKVGKVAGEHALTGVVAMGKSLLKIKLPQISLPKKSEKLIDKLQAPPMPTRDPVQHELDVETDEPTPAKRNDVFVTPKMLQTEEPMAAEINKTMPRKTSTKPKSFKGTNLPSIDLLDESVKAKKTGYTPQQLEELSRNVEARLQEFGIAVKVVGSCVGPVVTRFELELAPGIKVSRITTLAKDLARALSVTSVRVVEVIPGKSVIGIEIPNEQREVVRLKEILQASSFQQAESLLSLGLGKDIAGHPVIVDVAKMPHLLVAGTTGSGKSVGINAMLLSILLKARPDEVKLLMIDPKMLELSVYEGIPHLLAPVVTDMKEAANVLRWCVAEMDRRYRLMSVLSVRNLQGFNTKIKEAIAAGNPIKDPLVPAHEMDTAETLQQLPQIVVVIDELADMMMVVGKKVEELIARIAQKARAAGIHMILATQRPSVDVITGLIKANVPTRIAFQVSSRIDSRTILDQQGAEHLLGYGDMLYLPPGMSLPVRVHGAFVSDEEVLRVVAAWKERGQPEYIMDITSDEPNTDGILNFDDAEKDPLYDQAVAIVMETRRASISSVQRRLKIGYNRAARIVEAMEQAGLVSGMDHNGLREVMVPSGQ